MFVYVHKNYRCVAFTLSINMPENAKNSVLETLEIKNFLGERGPNPPPFGARSAPPPSFITLVTPLLKILDCTSNEVLIPGMPSFLIHSF